MANLAATLNTSSFTHKIDSLIRFFLYVLIFWIPYSNAVIETCVILSIILWIIKRGILVDWTYSDRKIKKIFKYLIKSFSPEKNILNKPIGIFLCVCLMSVFNSSTISTSLHGFFTKTLEWIVIYYLVCEVFTEKKHIYIVIIIFLFTAVSTAIDGVVQYHITGEDFFSGMEIARGGATAAFKHANGLAGYLTIVIPLSFSLIYTNFKKGKYAVIFFSVIFLLFLWTLFITFSRAGLMASFVGLTFLLFFINRKLTLWFFCGFLSILILFFTFGPSHIKQKARMNVTNIIQTFNWRIDIWQESLNVISERPLLGHGVNTYMKVLHEYRQKFFGQYQADPTYAHNCYIQMVGEIGILGLAAFLGIMASLFKNLIGGILSNTSKEESLKYLMLSLLSGFLAFLIHCAFDVNLYSLRLSIYFWYLTGLVICIYRLTLVSSKNNTNYNYS